MSNFNWKQFHKDLDIAMATWLTEVPDSSIHAELITFAHYSNEKQQSEA